jgi:5-methylcytosine-specific restriction protein A
LCIEHNRPVCSICGFDFEEKYGPRGKGFIHVHHVIPIHQIGKEYKIDYRKDLIPVCPNCHAMLHRKFNGKEPSIAELKEKINEPNK